MRNSRLLLMVLPLALCASTAAAEDVATGNITVNVNVAARTSLKVSGRVLHFDVTQPGEGATAAMEFTAGARLASGSDVVLTVEPLRGLEGPGGSADGDTALSFVGEGEGLLAGPIAMAHSTIVGRWQGSGLRAGRVLFQLRANAAGIYSLPVRFVLSTP
jgi:hypothetical protein